MTKKELLERIEQLERRVFELEMRPPVTMPYPVWLAPTQPSPTYPDVPYREITFIC